VRQGEKAHANILRETLSSKKNSCRRISKERKEIAKCREKRSISHCDSDRPIAGSKGEQLEFCEDEEEGRPVNFLSCRKFFTAQL